MTFATSWRYPWRPFRFKKLSGVYASAGARLRVLNVGCGNHSPATTKLWWPDCEYSGLDRNFDAYDESDLDALDYRYNIDLSRDSLDVLPQGAFDAIIASHVLEHLTNGVQVAQQLAKLLAPGGQIYIEFPSVRSLGLPSMPGCLNFCDDATHVRVHGVREMANVLMDSGLRIVRAGTRRDRAQIAALPALLAWKLLRGHRLEGSDLWDITGFASYLLARRIPADTHPNRAAPAD